MKITFVAFLIFSSAIVVQGAETPVEIPNANLAVTNSETGYPLQWVRRQWSTGASVPAEVKLGKGDGKVWLQAPAQNPGAVGWESPKISVKDLRNGFKVRCQIKVSADYKGNLPWVLLAWYNDTVFFKNTVFRSAIPVPEVWTEKEWVVSADSVPENATDVTVVMATISPTIPDANSSPKPTGTIYFSSLSISR